MVEFRPSTWVLLGVMCVLIFAPLFFLDVDGLPTPEPNPVDNTIRPSVPNPGPSQTNRPRANQPATNEPATNEPPAERGREVRDNEPGEVDPEETEPQAIQPESN